jgi:hypothetical protein
VLSFAVLFGQATLRRLQELVEEIAKPTSEVTDVESPLDGPRRLLPVQMERDFRLVWMLPRNDVVLSDLDRLSAARTDERRSFAHQTVDSRK